MLANALLWAAVILGTTLLLQGTPYAGTLLPILAGAAAGSVIVVDSSVRRRRESDRC